MVNNMTGLFFFFLSSFFQAWGHVALITSALPITSCPEGEKLRRETSVQKANGRRD